MNRPRPRFGGVAWLGVMAVVASTVAVVATSSPASPQAQLPDNVVGFEEAAPVPERSLSPMLAEELAGAVRSRFVDIPTGSVADMLGSTATLELFPDVTVTLEGDPAPVPGAIGSTTWSGLSAEGDYATFTFINGWTVGTVGVDGAVYQITPVSGEIHLIVEDGRVFPNESEPLSAESEPDGNAGGPTGPEDSVPESAESATSPVVDVLIWYDNAARSFYGGDAQAQSALAQTVEQTNEVFANSLINLSIQAVGIEFINYSGTGDPETELNRVQRPNDGRLDSIHTRRDDLGADLVSLISDLNGSSCGIGNLGWGTTHDDWAFTAVDASCASSNLSFAHELGHNLGAGHEPTNPKPNGAYNYSHGYRDNANGFRTIMAYTSGSCAGICERIPFFSAPNRPWQGHPTGSATQNNARTLNERGAITAAYRGSTVALAGAKVSAGDNHTCAITRNGAVRCWGGNSFGQLGYGNTNDIGDDERPGSVGPVDLGPGRTAVQISAGASTTCAVLDNGSVRCWGYNGDGRLGYGNTTTIGDNETPGSVGPVDLGAGRTAVQVATDGGHTCAVLDNGTVRCWGWNVWGQLGYGNTTSIGDNETPGSVGPVDLGAGRTAVQVATGGGRTCALLDNGTVRCWGFNSLGELGYGTTTTIGDNETPGSVGPVSLGAGRTAVQISGTSGHTCAVLDNGTVRCWGRGQNGRLGYGNANDIGDDETPGSVGPVDLGAGRTASRVSAGGWHTCAVLDNGRVRCWGAAFSGQLGYGNANDIGDDETPGSVGPVDLGAGRTASRVSAGGSHTCADLDNGTIRCWGGNGSGQLGYGNTEAVGDNETPGSVADVGFEGVTGSVTELESGAPLAGVYVAVLRTTDFSISGGAVTDVIGNFTVPVHEGSYFLYLIDPTGTHPTGFHGAPVATVEVPADGTVDADPTMTPTRGSVDATVTETGTGNPIPGVWGLALSTAVANTGATEIAVTADGVGQLTLPGLTPGNHFVGFVDPTGAHTTRFFPNSPNVPDSTPVTVTAGGTTPANVSLPAQTPVGTGATISGTVTEQGTGTPLSGARVVALRASDYSMVRGAVADGAGQYSLDLAAGDYKLAFLDSTGAHEMEWFDDLPNTGLGSAVTVTAPGTADAALSPTTGSVTGTVTDDLAGSPIGGVWVFAIGPAGIAGGAVSALDGTYTIAGLAPGTYRATFADPNGGRLQQYWDDSPDYEGATPFNVTAADTTTGIDAALATPASE